MSKNVKSSSESVTFLFHNIVLDNVPFCHRTLSLKFHFRLNSFTTLATPVENFLVKWTTVIEMERTISHDSMGKPVPSIVEVTVFTHNVKGRGKEEIAHGKFDLAQIVRHRNATNTIQLQSNILESSLHFDVDIRGGESFTEVTDELKTFTPTPLPEIISYSKNSWFNFKHNPDQLEADANILVAAATKI